MLQADFLSWIEEGEGSIAAEAEKPIILWGQRCVSLSLAANLMVGRHPCKAGRIGPRSGVQNVQSIMPYINRPYSWVIYFVILEYIGNDQTTLVNCIERRT